MNSFKAEALTKLSKMLSESLSQNALDKPDGQIEGYYTTEERTIMDCIIAVCDIPEEPTYFQPYCYISKDESLDDKDDDLYAWDGEAMHLPYYYLLKDISKRRPDLKNFDPRIEYKLLENGEAPSSNYITKNLSVVMMLIETLTRKEDVEDELVRALKYYLVIIYASNMQIDARLAKKDLGIQELVKKLHES